MAHEWWQDPTETQAHAFVNDAGWMRSSCGARWSVRMGRPDVRSLWRCPECVLAITTGTIPVPVMSEGEAQEAFGR